MELLNCVDRSKDLLASQSKISTRHENSSCDNYKRDIFSTEYFLEEYGDAEKYVSLFSSIWTTNACRNDYYDGYSMNLVVTFFFVVVSINGIMMVL